jgi:type I restriction enzyme, S subunit
LSEQNGLPEGWTWARLRDVASSGQKRSPKADGEGDFLYVDVEALDNSTQRIVAPKRLRNSEAPSRARLELEGGDVLFSLVRPYLKNIAKVPEELNGQIVSTAYCLVRPVLGVHSSFLFHFLTQGPSSTRCPPTAIVHRRRVTKTSTIW